MNIEEIDIKDIEFGEPIEERELAYRDGYIRGIYRARNIIDNQQKEIERLNNIINEVREYIKDACYLDEINYPNSLGHKQTMKVLEILDKEGNSNE